MRSSASATLTGLGVCIPEPRRSASEIAKAGGPPEWVVREKLGISSKAVPGPDDHPHAMGVRAAQLALDDAGVRPEDVDVVISMTEEHKEFPVWTAGIKLAFGLGANRAYAYDIGQKCGTGVLALKQSRDLLRASDRAQAEPAGYVEPELLLFGSAEVPRRELSRAAGGYR